MFGFTTVNNSGVWCNFCHELIIAPWEYIDDDQDGYDSAEQLECCPKCGADEDGPE